jgi:uncharacterized protein (DUF2235 family)
MPEKIDDGSIPFTADATSRRPARRPGKNIVLCADGTGNIGGETPDSNVYRVYKMVELHDAEIEQVKFYDNGVGTAKNKYWRAISGAFGGGFKSNVCDLYQFLARSYDPGDRIYLFGFSRGAATVRAFSGFIATCGLIDGRDLSQDLLRERTEEAYEAYKLARGPQKPQKAEKLRQPQDGFAHGVPPVEALCVWDSVAALGLPQNFKVLGLVIWFVNFLFAMMEKMVDWVLPHRFHNYELTANVRNAFHAIAIDDERLTFQPMVWDENAVGPETHVEQVWFAGAHSNVGGGYARNGLSSVALLWMMLRVEKLGLHFEDGALRSAADDVNEHGRLFDSRDGFSIYYRFEPRRIAKLCAGKLRGPVAIHRSALERIERRTANYAPGMLPLEFEVTDTPLDTAPIPLRITADEKDWQEARKRVDRWVFWRAILYNTFLEVSIWLALCAIYFVSKDDPGTPPETGWQYWVWNAASYALPASFENLGYGLILSIWVPLGLVGLFILFTSLKKLFRGRELAAREDARKLIRQAWHAVKG